MKLYEIIYKRPFSFLALVLYASLLYWTYNIFIMTIGFILMYLFILGANSEHAGYGREFINESYVFILFTIFLGSTLYAYLTFIPQDYVIEHDFGNDENISYIYDSTNEHAIFYSKGTKRTLHTTSVGRDDIKLLENGNWKFKETGTTTWYDQFESTSYNIVEN